MTRDDAIEAKERAIARSQVQVPQPKDSVASLSPAPPKTVDNADEGEGDEKEDSASAGRPEPVDSVDSLSQAQLETTDHAGEDEEDEKEVENEVEKVVEKGDEKVDEKKKKKKKKKNNKKNKKKNEKEDNASAGRPEPEGSVASLSQAPPETSNHAEEEEEVEKEDEKENKKKKKRKIKKNKKKSPRTRLPHMDPPPDDQFKAFVQDTTLQNMLSHARANPDEFKKLCHLVEDTKELLESGYHAPCEPNEVPISFNYDGYDVYDPRRPIFEDLRERDSRNWIDEYLTRADEIMCKETASFWDGKAVPQTPLTYKKMLLWEQSPRWCLSDKPKVWRRQTSGGKARWYSRAEFTLSLKGTQFERESESTHLKDTDSTMA
ncbi:hypothetical protein K402DRAFT_4852 [Aulographum hederae CBS 113979]|uniref:Uncharacterized protein n=1 Tax=Aulographum hederae CBS 113979 TaxID=1176131 RepID=A0A6G1HGJ6_9PEZI|nr:hypothetical protein K402DRAFT_4852 [Aulographum hederae CBS 113979]